MFCRTKTCRILYSYKNVQIYQLFFLIKHYTFVIHFKIAVTGLYFNITLYRYKSTNTSQILTKGDVVVPVYQRCVWYSRRFGFMNDRLGNVSFKRWGTRSETTSVFFECCRLINSHPQKMTDIF